MVQQHATRSHAKWNSSGAYRWTVCLGQPNKAENYPERPPSKHSLEGTAAHEILELCVEAFAKNQNYNAARFTNSPTTIFSVNIVMDYLTKLREDHPDIVVEGERRVWFPQDRAPQEECGGTLDIFLLSPSTGRAWVVDFKHGEGVPVEAIGNKQLLSYTTARLWKQPFTQATGVIIQPRCRHALGPVREWDITACDMVDFVAEIDDVLAIGSRKDAPLVAGSHCRWCPCEHDCTARDARAVELMQQDFAHVTDLATWTPPDPAAVPIDKLVLIRRHSAEIKAWLDAIDSYLVNAAVHQGIETPGFKVVEAQARRHFLENEAQVANDLVALANGHLGIDDVFPRKLIGITEAETRLVQLATAAVPHGWKKQAAEAMRARIALLTEKRSSGNLTLAPVDDVRPSTSKLAQDFGHIAGALLPPEPPPALQAPTPAPAFAYGALAAPIVDPVTLIHKD